MIDTIVFDLGRVLISWDPYSYMKRLFGEQIAEFLQKNIFETKEWDLTDKGEIEEENLWAMMIQRYPEYEEHILHMKQTITELLNPIEENVALLPSLKKRGYRLFVLSNFGRRTFEYIHRKYEFFKYFDGMVISSHVNQIKPAEDIFRTLINRYSVVPERAVFIDDKYENIQTAKRLSFNTIHLTDHKQLRNELSQVLGDTI
ncbi:MAG TPA: HAD family phosphatase [Pseudothermotoga sp.]|nr:HAD family phosphatase [Pseudothermotoga sp.]HOK82928.1 HAD family phosphatase [Pseudothermotoga sp.]HPP69898.1 HAD family phosphatase [Pseudothermotoga sp.]